ncbi:MAG TPA: S8 family peptidase [Gaiellaceae bacterium]|nr:S8 family peptidase [Gaiellaceae bacterium]
MRLRSLSAFLVLAALSIVVFAVPAATSAGATETQTYIVQFLDAPVVAYDGGVPGLAATKPGKGKKIDVRSAAVVRYADHLKGKHDSALAAVGGGQKLYDYVYSYNGVAAKLTDAQAAALAKQDGVLAVSPDELRTVDTSSTPSFLGLDAPGGLWEQLGGDGSKKAAGAGEGIVIGIVDSGIWPESKSFSDRDANGKLVFQQLPGWNAKCIPGEQFNGSNCNQKLIGAQYFNASWGGNAGIDAQRPWEFNSARDYNGHGSHTASTAGGNSGVQATGPASVFGKISGMAPRARISAYKVLWSTQDAATASGFTGDLVAAIDQAVADGVDVINYSISGTQSNFLDPAQVAFLFAADAGVFVAASAGNSGPANGTVAHPSPWITTVAAGTHNRDGQGSVTLGNGASYSGASVATPVGPAPLVDSVNVGKAGANPTDVQLCTPGTLDPAKVTGTIVLCLRGVIARVDKSRAVLEAGGVGMVIYNDPDSSLNADFHFVPSVHVDRASGLAIKAYAATSSPTATINQSTLVFNAAAPFTASFSSRGPSPAAGGDVLKPDVIAPGQDILAAVAPPGNAGRDFNLYSGTSMSSPHVAGLAALLKQKYPGWSPMAIKSALMTTGYDVLDGGTPAPNTNPALIFRQGAGHVQPNKAADPGLVYDSSFNDWLAFLCGTTTGVNPATCAALQGAGFSLDASDMNVPSIAIGDLAGIQTVKRRVTNVGSSPATYNAAVTGMAGITTVVTPSSLALAPGQTGSFTVRFTRTTATLNTYAGGQLTWSDGTHNVRVPLVVRPVALAAPLQVNGTGGPLSYNVTFGYDGPFTATARGLVAAVTESRTVLDDPTDSTCSLSSPNAQKHDIVVPAGTTYARFSLFDDFTDGNDDIDLCVFRGTTQVGGSGSGTSAEEVNLVNPTPATYTVVVQGWGTDGPDAQYTLFHWLLGSAAAGNMTVTAPTTATTGGTGTIGLTFSGLAPATKYLGSVAYTGVAGLPNPTIVRVDTP